MDEEWSKLQSYQHLQNKLFAELGPTQFGADDTVMSCRQLIELETNERPKFILERWSVLTDRVYYLLGQLKKLEENLEETP